MNLLPTLWTGQKAAQQPANGQPSPGPSRGILAWLGDWLGPAPSVGTQQAEDLEREKVRSGPQNIILPWFMPFFDGYSGETPAMRLAYRRMLADENVKAAVLGKLFAVASLTLKCHPADKKKKKDQKVAQFVEWNLTRRLKGGFGGLVMSTIFPGLMDGYSLAEKVWAPEEKGRHGGKVVLAELKSKDTGNDLVLKTDDKRNIVSVMGLRYNAGQEFHPSNFVHWSYLPLFGSPTGTSDFRAAYAAYWMLDTVWKLRLMGAERKAWPILVGTYATDSQKPGLETALGKARSRSWLAIPENIKIEAMNIAGQAEDIFKSTIEDLKHRVFLGIAGAILQSLEGSTTDGRGDSRVHQNTSDLFKWFLSSAVESICNDHDTGLVRDIVDLNYVVGDYPHVTVSSIDPKDLQSELAIDQGLSGMGVDLSRDEVYERYGRTPPKSPDDAIKPVAQTGPDAAGNPAPNLPPQAKQDPETVTEKMSELRHRYGPDLAQQIERAVRKMAGGRYGTR